MYGSNFCSATRYPCPSSSAPIDAAARPFPSEDTTPPVTRMYLTGRSGLRLAVFVVSVWCCIVSQVSSSERVVSLFVPSAGHGAGTIGGRFPRERGAHAGQVLSRIDSDRVELRLDHLYPDAMFQRA